MKKLILTSLLTLFSLGVFAQLNNNEKTTHANDELSLLPDTHLGKEILPPQVSTGFLNRNPEIEHATWTQEGENYAAAYEKEGETIRSEYNYDGTWIGDYRIIDKNDIPPAVKKQLDNDYRGFQIEEAYIIDTEEGVLYQFSGKDGIQENTLRFDPEGNEVEIAESMNNEKMEDSE